MVPFAAVDARPYRWPFDGASTAAHTALPESPPQLAIGARPIASSPVRMDGKACRPTRPRMRALGVCSLPEEPLHRACVGRLNRAENLALASRLLVLSDGRVALECATQDADVSAIGRAMAGDIKEAA